jgi:hypothetical protein
MPSLTDFATTAQEQILDSLKVGQDAVIDGLKTLSATVESVLADLPSLDAVPGFENVPFASELPTASEAVSNAFAFAQKLITAQYEFVESVLETVGSTAAKAAPGSPAPASPAPGSPAPGSASA